MNHIHMGTYMNFIQIFFSLKYIPLLKFIVNITHQHDNDKTLQAIICYAHYLMGLLVIT